jgi:hypothetical protein
MRRYTRRGLAAAAAAAFVLHRAVPVGAQLPCSVSFVNGILQFGADCTIAPAAMNGMTVTPPLHLAALQTVAATTGTTPQLAREERLATRRARRDTKRSRKRSRKDTHRSTVRSRRGGVAPVA